MPPVHNHGLPKESKLSDMESDEKKFVLSNFEDSFDPLHYAKESYRTPGTPENTFADFRLQKLHKFFADLFPSNLLSAPIKILDYGCGPVVPFAISAAGKVSVSEIVLADYTSRNRMALQSWLDKDPSAFDWSPYFKYVVQNLEGKPEGDVAAREKKLRSLVKIVSCDITADHPIEKGYEGPYDVVMSFLSIESVCQSESEYVTFIEKLARLVKPGGSLLLYPKLASVSQPMYYKVGSNDIYYYTLSCDAVKSALEKSSLVIIETERLSMNETLAGVKPSDYPLIDVHWDTHTYFYMLFWATKPH